MSGRSRERKNRVVAMIASLALVVGLVPVPALAAAGPGEPPVDSSPAAVPAAEPAATPVEESSKAAAPVEEGSEAAAPAEEESKAAIPVEEPSKAAAPAEDESKTAAPAKEPSKAAAPVEEKSQVAAPAEESSKAATPAEETGKAPAAEYPAFKQNATVGGVTVTVEAGAGAFPEGARLSVTAVSSSATEAAVAPERGAGESVAASYTFDIKVLEKDGEEVQPANGKSVKVSFAAAEVADPNLDVSVYHVSGGEAEELSVSESGSTATAQSTGFSYYTVEFTYGELQYVLQGGESVPLADVLATVGLQGVPTAAESSAPELFSVARDENGVWKVSAKQAFTSAETLTVTINGQDYEIAVTDEQSGTCGGNLTWTLDGGTLAISYTGSGSGAMTDFPAEGAPWYDSRNGITAVVIGSGVTSIGAAAFYGCTYLTSATIPDSVTSIGAAAFYGCANLGSVEIPGSVTSIGNSAFLGCASLTNVSIPASVGTIGVGAFSECSSLKKIEVANENQNYRSEGGVLYDKNVTTLIAAPGGLGSITIPGSVTSIEDSAFWGCTSLASVAIPGSVTSIGSLAFFSCTSLTSVAIPSSVTSIEDGAFWGCTSLASVAIPGSFTYIGEGAFLGCNRLKDVYYGGTPEQWGSVSGAFASNPTVHFACGNGVYYTLDDGTLTISKVGTGSGKMDEYNRLNPPPWDNYRDSITAVVIGDGVTSIGGGAFSSYTSLTSVAISDGVKSIGDYAFSSCTSLTSVDIPYGVTTIGENAFGDCNGLESVKIPSSVTTIGKQAFYQCGFTGVDIPSSVTTIGEGAFQGCSSLESVTIPDSVTSIGKVAFQNCTSLKSVTIPSSVTSVEYATFQGCKGLGSVTIPSSVTIIGVHAFNRCTSLTRVDIPSGVTSIGADAFEGCSRLTVVEIPSSVTSIGNYVFTSCKKLSAIKYDGTLEKWDSIDLKGDWAYNTPTDMVVICKYDGTVECNPQTGGTADARVEIKPNDEHPSPASIATAVPNAEAGYHFVSWTGDEGVSFADPTELETSFTATEAVPTITANFAKTFEVDNVEDQTYSGQDLTPVLTVKDAVTGSNLAKGDYSVSYQKKDGNPVTEIKNAGEYKVIVTGKNDYTGTTIEKPFTVEQAELTITAKDQSYTYTGYQQGEGDPAYDDPEIIKTKVDAEGLQGDDKITSIVLNGSQTDAGVYEGDSDGIVPSAAAIGVGGALNGNYKIAYVNGTLTIEPAKVTVTTGSASKVYDGKALTNAEASIEGLVKGESATVKATGSQTEVGSSKNTCSIEWGTAKARNYAVTEKLGTLTVEAAPVQEYTVTFENWDGTVLQSGKVAAGEVPVYEGAEPTRPETDQYLYVFDGWTPEVVAATSDATYTAVFEPALRTYDVIWLNDDGTELYRDVHVSYGQMPDYDGPTPTKPSDDKYTYAFSGWTPEVVAVTGDATYTAVFEPVLRTYDVIWLNDDGTELYRDVHVSYGQMPDYGGPTPTKPADDKYTYTFSGWTPEVVAVTGDATYTATYAETPKDKPVYKVVSGAGGSWTAGSGEPMVFKIERTIDPETAFSHFIGIDVDGKALPEKDASGKANWTARSGSVIVELQPAYLGTLSEGKHTLTALFDDGDPVTTEFKVAAKASPSPDKPAKGTSPKTGDPLAGAFVATIATAIIALIVMVAFAVRRRRA